MTEPDKTCESCARRFQSGGARYKSRPNGAYCSDACYYRDYQARRSSAKNWWRDEVDRLRTLLNDAGIDYTWTDLDDVKRHTVH